MRKLVYLVSTHPDIELDYHERTLALKCGKGTLYIDEDDTEVFTIALNHYI